jgi:CxxC-x17-CxxC domain-containing protein
MTFVFSAGEQEFFAAKGLSNEPKRCSSCRILARLKRNGNELAATEVECAECHVKTLVPFKPTGRKPVYCSACMRKPQTIAIAPESSQLVAVH